MNKILKFSSHSKKRFGVFFHFNSFFSLSPPFCFYVTCEWIGAKLGKYHKYLGCREFLVSTFVWAWLNLRNWNYFLEARQSNFYPSFISSCEIDKKEQRNLPACSSHAGKDSFWSCVMQSFWPHIVLWFKNISMWPKDGIENWDSSSLFLALSEGEIRQTHLMFSHLCKMGKDILFRMNNFLISERLWVL